MKIKETTMDLSREELIIVMCGLEAFLEKEKEKRAWASLFDADEYHKQITDDITTIKILRDDIDTWLGDNS